MAFERQAFEVRMTVDNGLRDAGCGADRFHGDAAILGQETPPLSRRRCSRRWPLARRKHLMEGSFADAANNHGFKRARWRGLWKQSIQDYLIAAVQNLRLLIARGQAQAYPQCGSQHPAHRDADKLQKQWLRPHSPGIGLASQSPSQSHLLAKLTSPHNSAAEATNQHGGINLFFAAGILSMNAYFIRFGNTT